MTSGFRFLKPLDVVFFRSNRLFDAAGAYSEALMPPPPSVFSGALRSFLMTERGFDPAHFSEIGPQDEALRGVIGASSSNPGTFRLTVASIGVPGNLFLPLPADLEVSDQGGKRIVLRRRPIDRDKLSGVSVSSALPLIPVLKVGAMAKPIQSIWLGTKAMEAYLKETAIPVTGLAESKDIWKTDSRVGIGMDPAARIVETGKLYSSDGIAFSREWGFVLGIAGSGGLLPKTGVLRLGGDGHGSEVSLWNPAGFKPWEFVPTGSRFRLLLATPGIFPGGWLPPGVRKVGDAYWLEFTFDDGKAFRARLAAASLGKTGVVSGWNLAAKSGGMPKPAQRTVPVGSVYWFDSIEGDFKRFCRLVLDGGLWPLLQDECANDATGLWRSRRAEGFNNAWFGEWKKEE